MKDWNKINFTFDYWISSLIRFNRKSLSTHIQTEDTIEQEAVAAITWEEPFTACAILSKKIHFILSELVLTG